MPKLLYKTLYSLSIDFILIMPIPPTKPAKIATVTNATVNLTPIFKFINHFTIKPPQVLLLIRCPCLQIALHQ